MTQLGSGRLDGGGRCAGLRCSMLHLMLLHEVHSRERLGNEVQRGEATSEVAKMRTGHPVPMSQSTLNRRRYARNDETLYVAPEDERTDYVSALNFGDCNRLTCLGSRNRR